MRFAQPNPSAKTRAHSFHQGLINEGMGMEMMVAIDEAALQAGLLKELPLAFHLLAHKVPGPRGKTHGKTGPGR